MPTGCYIKTKEHIKKIRSGNIGKTRSDKTRERIKLNHVGFSGNRHGILSKIKISLSMLLNNTGESRIGINNPNWKGGKSFEPYCEKFNERFKEKVRTRDNRTCQICGISEENNFNRYKQRLHVHHVHYDKKNCYPDVLSACTRCNLKMNSYRDYWEKECMIILENRCLLNWKCD